MNRERVDGTSDLMRQRDTESLLPEICRGEVSQNSSSEIQGMSSLHSEPGSCLGSGGGGSAKTHHYPHIRYGYTAKKKKSGSESQLQDQLTLGS